MRECMPFLFNILSVGNVYLLFRFNKFLQRMRIGL